MNVVAKRLEYRQLNTMYGRKKGEVYPVKAIYRAFLDHVSARISVLLSRTGCSVVTAVSLSASTSREPELRGIEAFSAAIAFSHLSVEITRKVNHRRFFLIDMSHVYIFSSPDIGINSALPTIRCRRPQKKRRKKNLLQGFPVSI